MSESRAQVFARLMSACEAGFDAPEHHRNWWKKHAWEIRKLPPSMGNRVAHAWEQATHKEFSKGAGRRG
jgi:hypothetical protein